MPWHSSLSAHGLGTREATRLKWLSIQEDTLSYQASRSVVSVELPSHVQSPPSIFCKIFCSGFLWFGQMPSTYCYLEFSKDFETHLKGGYDEATYVCVCWERQNWITLPLMSICRREIPRMDAPFRSVNIVWQLIHHKPKSKSDVEWLRSLSHIANKCSSFR